MGYLRPGLAPGARSISVSNHFTPWRERCVDTERLDAHSADHAMNSAILRLDAQYLTEAGTDISRQVISERPKAKDERSNDTLSEEKYHFGRILNDRTEAI